MINFSRTLVFVAVLGFLSRCLYFSWNNLWTCFCVNFNRWALSSRRMIIKHVFALIHWQWIENNAFSKFDWTWLSLRIRVFVDYKRLFRSFHLDLHIFRNMWTKDIFSLVNLKSRSHESCIRRLHTACLKFVSWRLFDKLILILLWHCCWSAIFDTWDEFVLCRLLTLDFAKVWTRSWKYYRAHIAWLFYVYYLRRSSNIVLSLEARTKSHFRLWYIENTEIRLFTWIAEICDFLLDIVRVCMLLLL